MTGWPIGTQAATGGEAAAPARALSHVVAVPPARLAQLFVGRTLAVKMDPSDPAQLFIDWDTV